MKNIVKLLIVSLVVFAGTESFAQCKNKSLAKLKPYISNGQISNTTLLAGDKTEVNMTFYYGDEYRIVISAAEALGKVQFNLKDANGNVVFTTKGYGTIQWDFDVQSTQDLTVEIIAPPSTGGDGLDKSGCVAVAVGFK